MAMERKEPPFKNLGERLRNIRQNLHKSIEDVSGAIEIDETDLRKIEQGAERPSEDTLMLLINHFEVHEDDALTLWNMAGYEQPGANDGNEPNHPSGKGAMLVLAFDPRVIYSDGVVVQGNKAGITMAFTQGAGTRQQLTSSRVGMSFEQAKNVYRVLGDVLSQAEPRRLPASSDDNSQTSPSNDRPKDGKN